MQKVKKGEDSLGIKAEHRLLQAEREAGLDTKQEEVLAAAQRAGMVSRAAGEVVLSSDVLQEELRGVHLADEVRALQVRADRAEQKLNKLRAGLRELLADSEAEPEPGHRPGRRHPDDASQIKGASRESAEAAFAGRDVATQMLKRQQAEKRGRTGSGAAKPLSGTGAPSANK